MALWAISGAPVLASDNLATMSADTKAVLTNPEVIVVDQDPLGRQGTKVQEDQSSLQVYSKVLSGSDRRAVVLLNRAKSPATITARWSALGTSGAAQVRNMWTATTVGVGTFTGCYSAGVPAGQAVLLTVTSG